MVLSVSADDISKEIKTLDIKKPIWVWRKKSPYSELSLRRDYLSVFSPNAEKSGKNADQNNSEYGLFLRSKWYAPTKSPIMHFLNKSWRQLQWCP